MARRYDCNDATDRTTGLREAASAVRRGELVVLPTDTVYGIGADAFTSEAVADLLDAKGRGRNMPTPSSSARRTHCTAWSPTSPRRPGRLVDAFWPGALTLVAKHQPSLQWDLGDTRGTVAIRMPLHPVAIELLTEVGPMAVSSANLTGHPSPEDCDAAQGMLGDSVSVYLDGGPTPGIVPSSIVDVTGATPVLLRAGCPLRGGAAQGGPRPRGGQLTAPEGRGIAGRTDTFRILHVSTGNVCRSPITERLTRHALVDRLGDPLSGGLVVESAGTWGHEGAPMEANAEVVLADFGADATGFVGRELLDEHVIRADLVLTATRDHRAQVISMGHSAGLRTFTLKEFTRLVRAIDPATLPDPRDEGVVERARALVRAAAALRGWLLAPTAEADEVYDPYGAPITFFRSIGDEINQALDPVVTALTGVRAPH